MRQKRAVTLTNIEDKNGNVIEEEVNIVERWRQYFKELLEGKDVSTGKP